MKSQDREKFDDYIKKAKEYWNKIPQKALEYTQQAEKLIDDKIDLIEKAIVYNSYGAIYLNLNKLDDALESFIVSLKIYKKLKNYDDLAKILNNIGSIHIYKKKYYEAISYFEQALSYKTDSNKRSIAKTYNNLGTVYIQIGDYKKAIEYFLDSLKLKEEFGDESDIASAWINLAIFYAYSGNFEEALDYNEKALEYYKKVNDLNTQADILQNIALIFQRQKLYKKAEEFLLNALKLKEESNNLLGMGNIYVNLGNNYSVLDDKDKAIFYLEKAYNLFKNTNDKTSLMSCLSMLGDIYWDKNIELAKKYYYEALDISIISKSRDMEYKIYQRLYRMYEGQNNYALALENLKKYVEIKEEVLSADTKIEISKLKLKYKLDKKEKENLLLKKENEIYKLKLRTQKKLEKAKEKIINQSNKIELISKELEKRIEKTLIGKSKAIKDVLKLAITATKYKDVNVFITGENGTGKEIIARIIHFESPRKDFPFFTVNSSAIPENLLESEFFGHTKGAFTGALKDKKGYFELANKGTLFLDEIADMPVNLQAKLLRAIEERKIKRVGDNKEIKVDIRIISATNRNIDELIEEKKFRLDLYHRINTLSIFIPPLRERKEDIEPLLLYFVEYFSKILNKKIPTIDKEVIDHLSKYDFPGNVRELRNMVERAIILSYTNHLTVADFPFKNAKIAKDKSNMTKSEEIELIKKTLIKNNFNKSLAAKEMNISRDALIRKMKKYGLEIIKSFNK